MERLLPTSPSALASPRMRLAFSVHPPSLITAPITASPRSCTHREGLPSAYDGICMRPSHRRIRVQCARPPQPERAPWEPPEPHPGGLLPKDRVAIHAQLSPESTLSALLDALSANARDEGIDALYAFANMDVWSVKHTFFGRAMDLGQFERFKRVVVAQPYDVLLRHSHRAVIAALTLGPAEYVARVRFLVPRRQPVVLVFRLVRRALASELERGPPPSWMVDSILVDAAPTPRSPPHPRA